jgi:hypothetical protein
MKTLAVFCWLVAAGNTNCTNGQAPEAAGDDEPPGQVAMLAPAAPSRDPLLRISDFDEDPFGFDLNAQAIKARFGQKFTLRKEAVANTHYAGKVDTILHFSSANSKLDIYKAQENEMLYAAQISDPAFALRNGIRVGISRSEFCGKFYELQRYRDRSGLITVDAPEAMAVYQLELQPDQITISNDAQTALYRFVFAQNRLTQIQIEFYLD